MVFQIYNYDGFLVIQIEKSRVISYLEKKIWQPQNPGPPLWPQEIQTQNLNPVYLAAAYKIYSLQYTLKRCPKPPLVWSEI